VIWKSSNIVSIPQKSRRHVTLACEHHDMTIQRGTVDDADALVAFWEAAGASMGYTDNADCVRAAIVSSRAGMLLAVDEGRIVGSLLGTFDGWRGHLYRLVVDPAQRRRGIATALVRQMEQLFRQWGVQRVNVLVERDRPSATAFWTSVGYPRDERMDRHVATLV
jgi:GNAT superfamily N-acetyltransferase